MPGSFATAHSEFCSVEVNQTQAVDTYLTTLAADVHPTSLGSTFTNDLIAFITPFFGTTEQTFFIVEYQRYYDYPPNTGKGVFCVQAVIEYSVSTIQDSAGNSKNYLFLQYCGVHYDSQSPDVNVKSAIAQDDGKAKDP